MTFPELQDRPALPAARLDLRVGAEPRVALQLSQDPKPSINTKLHPVAPLGRSGGTGAVAGIPRAGNQQDEAARSPTPPSPPKELSSASCLLQQQLHLGHGVQRSQAVPLSQYECHPLVAERDTLNRQKPAPKAHKSFSLAAKGRTEKLISCPHRALWTELTAVPYFSCLG